MNVKSLFEENNFTTEPSSPVRGDFGTFFAKSTEEAKAIVFAKTGYEAENKIKYPKSIKIRVTISLFRVINFSETANFSKCERKIYMSKKSRKIYVLLTSFRDIGSIFLRAITGCQYTHASIGLDEDMNTFYSFVCKGFIVEKIGRYLKPGVKPFNCKLYEMKVTEKVYASVKKAILSFVNIKNKLSYSKIRVAMCLFKIPYKKNRSFFCSQFVARILSLSKAAKLEKDSGMYFPDDLKKIDGLKPVYIGNHRGLFNKFCVSVSVV